MINSLAPFPTMAHTIGGDLLRAEATDQQRNKKGLCSVGLRLLQYDMYMFKYVACSRLEFGPRSHKEKCALQLTTE